MKVTAVVLVKNEEKNIASCLKTLNFFDEIVIVDDHSTDGTMAIIDGFRDPRIKIFQNDLENDFGKQRNFALTKSSNKYVFFVDADERIEKGLEEELKLLDESFDGYFIKRIDNMWGRNMKFGEVGNIYLLRLGNKEKGKWVGRVHERWEIEGKTRKLRNHIMHYPHQTISEFLQQINYYTSLRAQELYDNKVKSGFFSIILYTKGKFFVDYIFKMGFRDGVPGFLIAILMTFHSFLVRGKLWLLWQKS